MGVWLRLLTNDQLIASLHELECKNEAEQEAEARRAQEFSL